MSYIPGIEHKNRNVDVTNFDQQHLLYSKPNLSSGRVFWKTLKIPKAFSIKSSAYLCLRDLGKIGDNMMMNMYVSTTSSKRCSTPSRVLIDHSNTDNYMISKYEASI